MTESVNFDANLTAVPPARQVAAPAGYVETPLWDPFEAFMGPLFDKRIKVPDGKGDKADNEELWMAFYVDNRHLNMRGVVHGGMLATFADAVLGSVAWNATGREPSVTLSMQMNFLKGPKLGDLVECRATMTRKTRAILFVGGEFFVGDDMIMTASSLWKIIGK